MNLKDSNKKNILISGVTLLAMLFLFQNCGGYLEFNQESNKTNSSSSNGGGLDPSDPANQFNPDGTLKVNAVGPTVGVNSFQAIYINMTVITGVGRQGNCDTIYNEQKGTLPTTNDISTFSGGAQGTVLKLAACVCNEAIVQDRNGGRARLAPGLDYNKNVGNLNADDLGLIQRGLASAAWGEQNANVPANVRSAVGALAGQLQTDANNVREVVFGACTAVLSSLSTHIL